jgi:glycosyltransferase involved in cell wall biosynthesis
VVIGTGPEADRLAARAPSHVTFLGWQPDAVVHDHLARARGLLFPGEEDFGIVPVEAFARGCPVIAYGVGGATESVTPSLSGTLFDRQTVDDVIDAMRRTEAHAFDPVAMHTDALRFGRHRFLTDMRIVLQEALSLDLRGSGRGALDRATPDR